MPTKQTLLVATITWTVVLVAIGLMTAWVRVCGCAPAAEVGVALYVMVAFPSGLGWYDLSIGRYKEE